MALYVVVHHRRDQQQWANDWVDDDRLRAITTTAEIVSLCERVQSGGGDVYVHRCGWEGGPPMICCRGTVKRAQTINRKEGLVEFTDVEVLHSTPVVQPSRGQNWYESDPPEPARRRSQ